MRALVAPFLSVLALVSVPGPVAAQSRPTYVSALLAGDVVRGGSIDYDGLPVPAAGRSEEGSAAPALLLRAGTAIGERWGVEIEAGFGGSIESVRSFDVSVFTFSLPSTVLFPDGFLPPSFFAYERQTSQRRATVGASIWTRRQLGERAGLTFLGGLVFTRVRTEETLRFDNPLGLSVVPSHEATSYGAGPMAGIETDVRLTRGLSMSAGVRLHSDNAAGSAWVVRPAAGLRWSF